MTTSRRILAALIAVCFTTAAAFAASASPAGTWKYSQPARGGGQPVERTLTLEFKGGTLTGTLKGADMGQYQIPDTAISDASFTNGTIAFSVERAGRDGTKRVSKYSGKLEGDSIKGTVESPGRGGGAAQKTDWVATRAK